MIELHQFPSKMGVPNLSPFCMKVEAFLNAAGLPYDVVKQPDPRKAPLGKLPMIVDGQVQVPDSHHIIRYFSDTYDIDLDAHLSAPEKAVAHAFARMIEERLYWIFVFNRWVDDNWPVVKKGAFGKLPPVVKDMVPRIVQGKIKRDLEGQGLGRHEREAIYAFAKEDIQALADFLADKPYFMGDQISLADITVASFLCNIVQVELDSPIKQYVLAHPNLDRYQQRLAPQLFPAHFG